MNDNLILQKALSEACESELDKITVDIQTDEHIYSSKYNKKIKKLIASQKKPYFSFINTAGKRVACIASAVVILSASTFSVKAVRDRFFGFFKDERAGYDEITFISDSDDDSMEEQINTVYNITVPDGFSLVSQNDTASWHMMEYRNEDDNHIFFSQFISSNYKSDIDNERSKYEEYTDENGQVYMIYSWEDGASNVIIWNNGKYAFDLSANMDTESVLNIARSLQAE